jgi:UDPglucose--hexose-1-phosphate uridylyltransferase
MDDREQRGLAAMIKTVIAAYDRVFNISFPYMMVIHGRPSDGKNYDHYHFHIEFYPPLRTANKLKYLAGSETGAGFFINDTLPEDKAAELRKLVEPVVWKGVVK